MKLNVYYSAALVVAVLISFSVARDRDVTIESVKGRKIALLIGVSEYEKLTPLECIKGDVKLLRESLYKIGFEKNDVYSLVCGGASGEIPNRENIIKIIDDVLSRTREGDLLFIALEGHGLQLEQWQVDDSRLSDEAKGNPKNTLPRFCPIETNNASIEKLLETTISIPEIYEKIIRSGATYKLMFIDACRNSPLVVNAMSATDVYAKPMDALPPPPEGIVLLQSCGKGEKSYIDPDYNLGVYTYYFAEGITGKAADPDDGYVMLLSLASYAAKNTSRRVEYLRQTKQEYKNAKQVPFLSGETADIVLGKPLLINSIGMRFVKIPAGTFHMGTDESPQLLVAAFGKYYDDPKTEWFDDEYPSKLTTIENSFYLAQTETTRGQFARFVLATRYKTSAEQDGRGAFRIDSDGKPVLDPTVTWQNPGFDQDDSHPVVNVSWHDANAFCKWLSEKEGKTYRLPTEAEWEYAARAGTETRYWFGDDPEELAQYDNVADATGKKPFPKWDKAVQSSDGYVFTAPVDALRGNPWGIFGVHGNVAEWCGDLYNPSGDGSPQYYNVRGGSWYDWPNLARSSKRSRAVPFDRHFKVGFRVVLEAE